MVQLNELKRQERLVKTGIPHIPSRFRHPHGIIIPTNIHAGLSRIRHFVENYTADVDNILLSAIATVR